MKIFWEIRNIQLNLLNVLMIAAELKRKTNISEYVIYIYQAEDLVRKYNFSSGLINNYIDKNVNGEDGEKEELKQWYSELAQQMLSEGLQKSGHVQTVNEITKQLSELNKQLLKSDIIYRKLYDQGKLHIIKYINSNSLHDDIEACLHGMYQYFVLKSKNKIIDDSFKADVHAFNDVMYYICSKYHQRKAIQAA